MAKHSHLFMACFAFTAGFSAGALAASPGAARIGPAIVAVLIAVIGIAFDLAARSPDA